MNNIYYKILSVSDVYANFNDLLKLMDIVLMENISQCFDENISREYLNKLPKYIEENNAFVIGAYNQDKLIGFHWCYYTKIFGEKRVHSNFVCVLPNYKGCGIAHEMMKMIEKISIENNVNIIEAMVTYDNKVALRYHEKNGFQIERLKMRKVLK